MLQKVMNFQARKKVRRLIRAKVPNSFGQNSQNHRFGQSFATFRTNYNVFFISIATFRKKLCKTTMFWRFVNFSAKNHHLAKSATFRKTTMFWHVHKKLFEQTTMFWHFDQKKSKSASFREKARKSSIWPNCNFSKKLPCFCISMNFSARKKLQKCLVS